jgi:molybdopterin converting factor small subunit
MFGVFDAPYIDVPGKSLGEILIQLQVTHPDLVAKILDGGRIAPWLSIVVDGDLFPKSLSEPIEPGSEIHFIPAISGG